MATKKKTKKAAKKQSKSAQKMKAARRAKPKKAKRSAKSSVKTLSKKAGKPVAAKKGGAKKAAIKKAAKHRARGKADLAELMALEDSGLGARTGGQSGDTQGLSGVAQTDSESVKELLEEGQSFEAEVVEGIENVADADKGEVRTHEVPEDDVPEEYLDKD